MFRALLVCTILCQEQVLNISISITSISIPIQTGWFSKWSQV